LGNAVAGSGFPLMTWRNGILGVIGDIYGAFRAMTMTKDGILYVATYRGIFRYDGKKAKFRNT